MWSLLPNKFLHYALELESEKEETDRVSLSVPCSLQPAGHRGPGSFPHLEKSEGDYVWLVSGESSWVREAYAFGVHREEDVGVFPPLVHTPERAHSLEIWLVPAQDGSPRKEMCSPCPKEVPGIGSEVIALPTNGSQSAQGPRGEGPLRGEGM